MLYYSKKRFQKVCESQDCYYFCIIYGLYVILHCFHINLYGLYMVLYCVYMIFIIIIAIIIIILIIIVIIVIIIIIIIIITISWNGASLFECPVFYLTINVFRIPNVRPEIPTTTDFFQCPVFLLTTNVFPDFESSSGLSDYH